MEEMPPRWGVRLGSASEGRGGGVALGVEHRGREAWIAAQGFVMRHVWMHVGWHRVFHGVQCVCIVSDASDSLSNRDVSTRPVP
eukprot:2936500-Rhodomonas_salina.1